MYDDKSIDKFAIEKMRVDSPSPLIDDKLVFVAKQIEPVSLTIFGKKTKTD